MHRLYKNFLKNKHDLQKTGSEFSSSSSVSSKTGSEFSLALFLDFLGTNGGSPFCPFGAMTNGMLVGMPSGAGRIAAISSNMRFAAMVSEVYFP